MRYFTLLGKLIVLISMVTAALSSFENQASAQKAQRKPARKFQRMATVDDLESRRESTVVIPIDRLRQRPLPAPVELPPFVKPGEKISAGMLRDVEPYQGLTPRRIDVRKPIRAPEERKP